MQAFAKKTFIPTLEKAAEFSQRNPMSVHIAGSVCYGLLFGIRFAGVKHAQKANDDRTKKNTMSKYANMDTFVGFCIGFTTTFFVPALWIVGIIGDATGLVRIEASQSDREEA